MRIKLISVLAIILMLTVSIKAFALPDWTDGLTVPTPSKIEKTVNDKYNAAAMYLIGALTVPVKQDYKIMYKNITALVPAGGTRKVDLANFVMSNYTATHPYPSQVRLKNVSIALTASTTARLFIYSRSTYDGGAYSLDNYLSSVNFASLTAAPYGSDYIQDVQCDIPYIDLDKTNVLHFVFKNTGGTSTRAFISFIYE